MFKVLLVNSTRHLINVSVSDLLQDNQVRDILKYAPADAIIDFVEATDEDFKSPKIKLN
jgi:translation initiation factor 2 alpha subunit (eIF-2alpha)